MHKKVLLSTVTMMIIGCMPIQKTAQPEVENLFLKIIQVGQEAIRNSSILDDIVNYNPVTPQNKIMIAKFEDFTTTKTDQNIDEYDLALENGFVKELIENGLHVVEKLDNIFIRDKEEFINTKPDNAFYMHTIDLQSLQSIKNSYNVSWLLQYQILEFQKNNRTQPQLSSSTYNYSNITNPNHNPYVWVYFRLIRLEDMKIISSSLAMNGDEIITDEEATKTYKRTTRKTNEEVLLYDKSKYAIETVSFEENVISRLSKTAILDIDILNISGNYLTEPQKNLMAIENGLISGLMNNLYINYKNNPFLVEKTSGFLLKYPEIYNNLVFNTNPILYDDWQEFVKNTNCTEIIMYRFLPSDGFYIRIVDAVNNGEIIYSNFIPFNSITESNNRFSNIHNAISKSLSNSNSTSDLSSLISGKKMIIVDGNYQPVQAEKYENNRKYFNAANLAVEEGIITYLTENSNQYGGLYTVHEKLKTLYLKKPWMYEDKIFNMNPLYLNNWADLNDFGIDLVLVYTNLIPYESIKKQNVNSNSAYTQYGNTYSLPNSSISGQKSKNDFENIALSYRIIDIKTGEIIFVGEISNL